MLSWISPFKETVTMLALILKIIILFSSLKNYLFTYLFHVLVSGYVRYGGWTQANNVVCVSKNDIFNASATSAQWVDHLTTWPNEQLHGVSNILTLLSESFLSNLDFCRLENTSSSWFEIHPYNAAAILDLQLSWTDINNLVVCILKMACDFVAAHLSEN